MLLPVVTPATSSCFLPAAKLLYKPTSFIVFSRHYPPMLLLNFLLWAYTLAAATSVSVTNSSSTSDLSNIVPIQALFIHLVEENTEMDLLLQRLNAESQRIATIRQRKADEVQALYDAIWPYIAEPDISPLERLHRAAILLMKNLPDPWFCLWAKRWQDYYLRYDPFVAGDTRTLAQRLFAYTIARKAGTLPANPDYEDFEQTFDEAFRERFCISPSAGHTDPES